MGLTCRLISSGPSHCSACTQQWAQAPLYDDDDDDDDGDGTLIIPSSVYLSHTSHIPLTYTMDLMVCTVIILHLGTTADRADPTK